MPRDLHSRTGSGTVSPAPVRRCSVAPVHFVIMGCGRVGASLARAIERAGHEVAVIDQDETSFRRLGTMFEGRTVTGVGFDRDTLRAAGIDTAYAFAAVSSGDNSNILAARVAREKYGVENVVARIYDPGRAEIYQRLGIPTVATVKWTSDQMLRRLLPQGHVPEFTDPSGQGRHRRDAGVPGLGRPPDQRDRARRPRAPGLPHAPRRRAPPGPDTVYQEGDLLHIALARDDLATAERILDSAPPAH